MKKKRFNKFIFACFKRSLIFSFAISLFVFVPTITKFVAAKEESLSKKFLGEKADYQGIITLWNVDTFESGSASKISFLENVSLVFEKKNRGAYIKVDNLTIDEFMLRIKENKRPDIFSFGTGVESYLKQDMMELPNQILQCVKANFLSCGLSSKNILAVPWSYSIYTLISSSNRIEKAGKTIKQNLKDFALDLAFDTKLKKSTKHTVSITFGGNNYVHAVNNLLRNFDINLNQEVKMGKIDEKYNKNTFYDAYVNFINNKSSVLLGTNRDVFRMENRKFAGKESDIIYDPLINFTDLVNYVSVTTKDQNKQKTCIEFINFMLSSEVQLRIKNIGMFSTTKSDLYIDGVLKNIEEKINESLLIKNLF